MSYLGVRQDHLIAIGKVIVGTGRLETSVRWIATHLGLKRPRDGMVSDVANRAIARVERFGVPPWSSADATALIAWLTTARELIGRRHPVVHSSYVRSVDASGNDIPVGFRDRNQERWEVDVLSLEMLAADLSRHTSGSYRFTRHLQHMVRPGFWVPHYWEPPDAMATYGEGWDGERAPDEAAVFMSSIGRWPNSYGTSDAAPY